MNKCIFKGLSIALVLSLASCSAPKKVPYMVDAETIPAEILAQVNPANELTVVPGDLLNIEVSGTDMTAVLPFNKGAYMTPEGTITRTTQTMQTGGNVEASTNYYLVDKNGDIDFPIVGKLHIGGKSKSQVVEVIQDAISPKFLKERPTVDIRFMNFRVTVTGAVKSPGVVDSENERMNLLEALAKAGDLDIKGQRENIMLIRTNTEGVREIHRLNLNDKNILLSPYFNLQQNDIIYVQPNKSAANGAWQMNPAVGATITIVGGLSSIASLVVGIMNLTK